MISSFLHLGRVYIYMLHIVYYVINIIQSSQLCAISKVILHNLEVAVYMVKRERLRAKNYPCGCGILSYVPCEELLFCSLGLITARTEIAQAVSKLFVYIVQRQ